MDGKRAAPLLLSVTLGLALLGGETAGAATRPLAVGVADQSPATFEKPLYRRLGVSVSRLMVPLGAALDPDRREWVAHWLAAAQADGVEPLVAFTRFYGTPLTLP